MQNNLKTGMHMHSDPQMRIRLQVFWSIVTITCFSTMICLRSACKFFWHRDAIDATIQFFVDLIKPGLLFNEKKKKNQDNCLWPSRTGILQSSQTKAALLEEWIHDNWNRWKAVTRIVGKYIFRKYISSNVFDLKIEQSLDIQRNKRILNLLEYSLKETINTKNIHDDREGKKVSLFSKLNFCFAKSDLRVWEDSWEKNGRKGERYRGKALETCLCSKQWYCQGY